jgi:membrane protease YdiL (CAAX protease family)
MEASRSVEKGWFVLVFNIVLFLTYLPYAYELVFLNHYSEGYEGALVALVVDVCFLPIVTWYLFKKKFLSAKILFIEMIALIIIVLSGPVISVYVIMVGSIVGAVVSFNIFYSSSLTND